MHRDLMHVQLSSLVMKKIIRSKQWRLQITKCRYYNLESPRMLRVSKFVSFFKHNSAMKLFYSLDWRFSVSWHHKFIGARWRNILATTQRPESKENCHENSFGFSHRVIIKFSCIPTSS